jgi:hypothetical protein
MRISDCGLENRLLLSNPHSAFRIPQSKNARPGGLRVAGALFRPTCAWRAAPRASGRSCCFSRLIRVAGNGSRIRAAPSAPRSALFNQPPCPVARAAGRCRLTCCKDDLAAVAGDAPVTIAIVKPPRRRATASHLKRRTHFHLRARAGRDAAGASRPTNVPAVSVGDRVCNGGSSRAALASAPCGRV